jgi:hypothetical protein
MEGRKSKTNIRKCRRKRKGIILTDRNNEKLNTIKCTKSRTEREDIF